MTYLKDVVEKRKNVALGTLSALEDEQGTFRHRANYRAIVVDKRTPTFKVAGLQQVRFANIAVERDELIGKLE